MTLYLTNNEVNTTAHAGNSIIIRGLRIPAVFINCIYWDGIRNSSEQKSLIPKLQYPFEATPVARAPVLHFSEADLRFETEKGVVETHDRAYINQFSLDL